MPSGDDDERAADIVELTTFCHQFHMLFVAYGGDREVDEDLPDLLVETLNTEE